MLINSPDGPCVLDALPSNLTIRICFESLYKYAQDGYRKQIVEIDIGAVAFQKNVLASLTVDLIIQTHEVIIILLTVSIKFAKLSAWYTNSNCSLFASVISAVYVHSC